MSTSTTRTGGGGPRVLAAKVPEITALFWAIKILTTGMGESMSDFLGQESVPLAGLIGVFGLWYALRRQLRATAYHAPTYWAAVMMVAVFGTMAADGLKDGAGLSYAVTTPFFAGVVGLVFLLWHRREGTLDIHSITTARRERYYWAAVLATFALGTSAGDLTAVTLGWGFFPSAILFTALILVPLVAWWRWSLNPVVAFWAAYVITRPLGASLVDWLAKPSDRTGLGLSDGVVSGLTLVCFVALVAYTAVRKGDIQRPHLPHPHVPDRAHAHVGGMLQPQPAEG